jgi:hypothetical protein
MISREDYINARNTMLAYEKQLKDELLNVTKDITSTLERDTESNLCLKNYVNTCLSSYKNVPKVGISKRVYNALKRDYEFLGISPEPTLMDLHRLSLSKFEDVRGVNKKSVWNITEFAEAKGIFLLP